jgi:hypothetical protein
MSSDGQITPFSLHKHLLYKSGRPTMIGQLQQQTQLEGAGEREGWVDGRMGWQTGRPRDRGER